MGIQINGNTNNINAGIGSLSIEDLREIDIVGVATASNFKTGVSNLHDVGLTLSGGQLDVGSNIKIGNAGVITATSYRGDGSQLTGITGTTINNNADNRLITGSGTANTLEGESSLTYDGTSLRIADGKKLGVNGAAPQTPIDVIANASGYAINVRGRSSDNIGEIRFTSNNYGSLYSVLQTGSTYLNFQVGSTSALRIKSNGMVNIGTNNQASGHSSSKLRVGTASGSDTGVVVFGNNDTTTPALVITNWDGAQTQNKSVIHFDNSGWGSHQIGSLAGSDGFGIYDDSVLRMSINNVGNTTFHSTGHIVLPSGTTSQRVNTSGAIRYNSSLGNLEFYDGASWKRVRLLESAPTTGLLAYWPFSSASRSGSTYNDVSGNGQHLTVNGTITNDTTETKFSGCIDFGTADGNHYLKSSSNSFTDIDATSGFTGLSISVWVKTSGTQNQWIISEGTVNTRWAFFNESANAPKWRSTTGYDITQTGSILTGNWHHLVVTYNHSNRLVQHYRDGSLTNSGTVGAQASFTGGYLLVGQHSSLAGNVGSYRWRGKMAHMRLYNRVLTSTEVTTLHQQW